MHQRRPVPHSTLRVRSLHRHIGKMSETGRTRRRLAQVGRLTSPFTTFTRRYKGQTHGEKWKELQPSILSPDQRWTYICHQCNQDLEIKSHKCSTAIRRIMNTLRYNVQRPHSSRFGSVLINILSFCRRLATFFLAQSAALQFADLVPLAWSAAARSRK